jgi:Protein of unknown function
MIYQTLAKVFLICSNPFDIRDAGMETMDKTQAKKIRRHLRAIDSAITKAVSAIFELDKEDRWMFIEPLAELQHHLHFKALKLVYAQYPELRPPPERPTISSDLRWKDVTLPKSVSEADLDAIIFSILTSREQKTARVIGTAVTHCEETGLPIGAKIFGARIEALAEAGRIQAFGDPCFWTHSELKLND